MQFVELSIVTVITGLLLLNVLSGAKLIKEVKRLNNHNNYLREQVMRDQALFVGGLRTPYILTTGQLCRNQGKTVEMKKVVGDCRRNVVFQQAQR